MPSYFRQVPDFEYVSRDSNQRQISEYATVKNLFRRGKLRDDIFGNLSYFTKYKIIGDERPDNVAYKLYNDETLDWVILLSNNILNIQTEWPLPQSSFDAFLVEKYGSYDTLFSGIHHYETQEIKDSNGVVVLASGLQVDSDFTFSYYDELSSSLITRSDAAIPVTNYEYEEKLQEDKRNIFLLKPRYLNVVFDDLEEIMAYEKGSTQYVSETLKRGDNIRIYQ